MPLSILNANHIGSADDSRFEPQRTNNALLHIAGLNSVAATLPAGVSGPLPQGNEDILTLSLSTFPLPKRTIGILEVGYLNQKRKFAGNPTYDDLSVVYKDYIEAGTAKVLWKWNYLVHNPTTGQTGLARQYKKSGWVSLYSPEGSIERKYDLIGIWPSGFDPGDIDMMGEDTVNITMTLTIDLAIPNDGLAPDA